MDGEHRSYRIESLDELIRAEYGITLEGIWNDVATMTLDANGRSFAIPRSEARLMRLIGISLKRAFAEPEPINPNDPRQTKTGAHRKWNFSQEAFNDAQAQFPEEWKVLTAMLQEYNNNKVNSQVDVFQFAKTNVDEGSWFRDLAHYYVRPLLCIKHRNIIIRFIPEIVSHGVTENVKQTIDRLAEALKNFLAVPHVIITLLAILIAKIGLDRFCTYADDAGGIIKLGLRNADYQNS